MIDVRAAGRDLAIGVSLANLMFMRVWAELFAVASPKESYYLKLGNRELLAVPLDVLLLGALFAAAASARRWGGAAGRTIVDLGVALTMLVLLSNLGPLKAPGALILGRMWRGGQLLHLAVVAALFLALVFAAFRWRLRARQGLTTLLLVLSPFALLNASRAAFYAATINPDVTLADRTSPLGSGEDAPDGPRVIVLLFDAMGRGLSIEDRPDGVAMPELDRLRAGSLDATNVTQAGKSTKYAVPGLLTGVRVTASSPVEPDELRLELADGRVEEWDNVDNLFREARKLGGRATVAGWYHPYCRLLEEDLSDCSWHPSATAGGRAREAGLSGAMVDALAATFPYTVYRRRHVLSFQGLHADAERAITRHGAGFTYVHINVPHHPYVYDRTSGELTVLNFGPTGYLDGLALADRTLGELRAAMERAGTWESSTVLVTADHVAIGASKTFRSKGQEVPAILKFPGQTEGVVYDAPFHATALHGVLRGALRGEVLTSADAIAWLNGNAGAYAAAPVSTGSP